MCAGSGCNATGDCGVKKKIPRRLKRLQQQVAFRAVREAASGGLWAKNVAGLPNWGAGGVHISTDL